MKIVIALGGNAILQRKEPLEADIQKKNIAIAAKLIAQVADEHEVIVTHGNGPQVGLLALQNDAYKGVSPYPLDVLGAESEGMIGYVLTQALKNYLPNFNVVSLLTQTLVDANDIAFQNPTKFVGPIYSKNDADHLAKEKEWVFHTDGDHYRRVVPSPMPLEIIEETPIAHLTQLENTIVICAGGGGIPVCYDQNRKLYGVEAVVDKDRASDVLAQKLDADCFIMLTDVSAVETHFGETNTRKIKQVSPVELSAFSFAAGSMGPKVASAISFANASGKHAAIGALSDLLEIVTGQAGTHIKKEYQNITYYN